MGKIVFFEGICGSGKSTTGHLLTLHMQSNGHAAEWIYEHKFHHPLYVDRDVQLARGDSSGKYHSLFNDSLLNWRTMVEKLEQSDEIKIFDGAFFQMSVGTMLLMNMDPVEIRAFVAEVCKIIANLNPTIIYLDQENTQHALLSMLEERGSDFSAFIVSRICDSPFAKEHDLSGVEGLTEFFVHYRQLIESIMEESAAEAECNLTLVQLDKSLSTWLEINSQLSDFFGLPPMPDYFLSPAGVNTLVGSYEDMSNGDILKIEADSLGLYLVDGMNTRLLVSPKDSEEAIPLEYLFSGMCIECRFQDSLVGGKLMKLTGDLPGLNENWVKKSELEVGSA
ncbi:MAG: hypothetical protein ACI945_001351 [Pseudohongiellaceae bacterium]|jgi:hypothetical protein